MNAYCEQQDLSVRQRRIQFDKQQSVTQTHLPSWKWRTKTQLTCPAPDTRCLLYPEVLWQTKNTFSTREPQFGPTTSCYYNTLLWFSHLHFPFCYWTQSGWFVNTHAMYLVFNSLANVPVELASVETVCGEVLGLWKRPLFSLEACLFNSFYFCFIYFYFWYKVCLHKPGCSGTRYVDQAGLPLTEPTCSFNLPIYTPVSCFSLFCFR